MTGATTTAQASFDWAVAVDRGQLPASESQRQVATAIIETAAADVDLDWWDRKQVRQSITEDAVALHRKVFGPRA